MQFYGFTILIKYIRFKIMIKKDFAKIHSLLMKTKSYSTSVNLFEELEV